MTPSSVESCLPEINMMPRYLIESAHVFLLPHKNISDVSYLEKEPNLMQNDLEQFKFRNKLW